MNQAAVLCVKLGYSEVPVTGNECFSVRGRPELNVLVDHGFAQIYLQFIESNITPTIYLYHMVPCHCTLVYHVTTLYTKNAPTANLKVSITQSI